MALIRAAQYLDLLAVAELERTVFDGHGYPAFFFRQALDCWPKHFLVADGQVGLLGYALWVPAATGSRDAWLLSLAVAHEARGQGVARQLLTKVKADACDYQRLLLTVSPNNQAALALYLSEGFTVVARDDNYFKAQETRLVLARTL